MANQIFFTDSGLTTPLAAALQALQKTDNSLGPVDFQLYIGWPDAAYKLQAESNPGADAITITINDADGATGQTTTAVTLATTQAGLDTATAGASLSFGTEILGGAANAQTFWVRVDDETGVAGSYTDLSLDTNNCIVVPV